MGKQTPDRRRFQDRRDPQGRQGRQGLRETDPTGLATEAFLTHRNLLFTVAYEMLGSAADAEDVELAESVSTAMLLVLETLAPTERAVFVLREVFRLEYGEIAVAVGKTLTAVRQTAHRARGRVGERRPRGAVSAAEKRRAIEAFRRAVETGELQGLLDLLAPDVVLLGDGGGVRRAVPHPVVGAERVARLLTEGLPRLAGTAAVRPALVNGGPALLVGLPGETDSVVTLRLDDGLITALYVVRNPEKLSRLTRATPITR
ncbi:sigma factor-like helix-turn-helix DNA-binding protein [Kitasatospora sp. NPDC004723]|uniref:sigma factor-like helix-turn-helix DNA-binding protein n=1 Tax=Kitasatospora sp. NPDC004723 TaxID=3154288 RepID=UPI0033B6CF21